jgi:hypothetical protein
MSNSTIAADKKGEKRLSNPVMGISTVFVAV